MKPEDFDLQKLAVTKIDAARRQLETAITLWFHDADPVSIHALAAAAYEVLHQFNSRTGGPSMIIDCENIKEEYKDQIKSILKKPQNFFKHAKSDPLETLLYAPRHAEAFILESCSVYVKVGHENRPLMRLFVIYMSIHWPELFMPSFQKTAHNGISVEPLKRLSKNQFFHLGLPLVSRIS